MAAAVRSSIGFFDKGPLMGGWILMRRLGSYGTGKISAKQLSVCVGGCITPTMKLRVNCVGIVGFLSNGAFMNWATDVQHQANGRSGDGLDIIVARMLEGVGGGQCR